MIHVPRAAGRLELGSIRLTGILWKTSSRWRLMFWLPGRFATSIIFRQGGPRVRVSRIPQVERDLGGTNSDHIAVRKSSNRDEQCQKWPVVKRSVEQMGGPPSSWIDRFLDWSRRRAPPRTSIRQGPVSIQIVHDGCLALHGHPIPLFRDLTLLRLRESLPLELWVDLCLLGGPHETIQV
jgi:hypothetical protein